MTKYTKEFLEYEELADLAMSRGLIVESKDKLVATLQQISYYRLSAYWFQYKEEGSDNFVSNTTLDTVLDIYEFDHKLRSITFNAISAFEISLRNDILHTHAKKYGKFGYAVKRNLPNLIKGEHNLLLKKLSGNREKSAEEFIIEYNDLHGDEDFLPIWMAVETLSLGSLNFMYKGLEGDLRKSIADKYFITKTVLISWIDSLVYIRNLCAHHSRLWNRKLAVSPIAPKKDNNWKKPELVRNNSFYAIALVLNHFHRIMENDDWKQELNGLLREYAHIPVNQMGFPETWQDLHMWQ